LALAKQFVSRLEGTSERLGTSDSGHLYWEEAGRDSEAAPLVAEIGRLLQSQQVLGLKPERGIPLTPPGRALACRLTTGTTQVRVDLASSDERGRRWVSRGSLTVAVPTGDSGAGEVGSAATELVDSISAGLLEKVARVTLIKGPRSKGKETYIVRIDNGSPLILSGLAIAGAESSQPTPFAALAGLSVSPSTSLRLPISLEMVDRLGLKERARVVAADLGGL
jgi:hypothetical protein